jgi:chromosome segregation ATPase
MQAILERKLASAEKVAQAYGPMRAGWAASMLRLDAYRQVFEALVNSMTTYKPLLTRIKREYDSALEEALKSSYQNIQMRADLTDARAQQIKSVDSALQESETSAVTLRRNLLDQLTETEERALAAEHRAADLENSCDDARRQLRALQRKSSELLKDNNRILQQMVQKSTWHEEPVTVPKA